MSNHERLFSPYYCVVYGLKSMNGIERQAEHYNVEIIHEEVTS